MMYRANISVGAARDPKDPVNSRTFEEREQELLRIEKAMTAQKKREEHSRYKRFVQFNLEETENLMWLSRNHPTAQTMLHFLTDQMNKINAFTCTYKALAEALGISERTAIRSINVLKEKGFIKILKNGTANVYHINSNMYWKNKGNRVWQAEFTANVLLSLSEQDDKTKEDVMDGDTDDIKIYVPGQNKTQ